MSHSSGLTVRHYERETIELTVEFIVCDAHREQVRFSPMSTAVQPHVARGQAVDVSTGGMGLICRQFIPRMCEGTVRVFDPGQTGRGSDGSPVHEIVFEQRVKVRRVTLASHEPTYALGVAFIDPDPDINQRVADLLKLIEGTAATGAAGGGGADA